MTILCYTLMFVAGFLFAYFMFTTSALYALVKRDKIGKTFNEKLDKIASEGQKIIDEDGKR